MTVRRPDTPPLRRVKSPPTINWRAQWFEIERSAAADIRAATWAVQGAAERREPSQPFNE